MNNLSNYTLKSEIKKNTNHTELEWNRFNVFGKNALETFKSIFESFRGKENLSRFVILTDDLTLSDDLMNAFIAAESIILGNEASQKANPELKYYRNFFILPIGPSEIVETIHKLGNFKQI